MIPPHIRLYLKDHGYTAVRSDSIRTVTTQHMISFRDLQVIGHEELERFKEHVDIRMAGDLGRSLLDSKALTSTVGFDKYTGGHIRRLEATTLVPPIY